MKIGQAQCANHGISSLHSINAKGEKAPNRRQARKRLLSQINKKTSGRRSGAAPIRARPGSF